MRIPNLFGKRTLILAVGSLVGLWAAETWLFKTGVVPMADGFGMDDVARIGAIVLGITLVDAIL